MKKIIELARRYYEFLKYDTESSLEREFNELSNEEIEDLYACAKDEIALGSWS